MGVNYVTNDNEVMSDYLVVDVSHPFMEQEVQFPSGFESQNVRREQRRQCEGFNVWKQPLS